MNIPTKLNTLAVFLVCLMLLAPAVVTQADPSFSGFNVTPGAATANSMFEVSCTVLDDPSTGTNQIYPDWMRIELNGSTVATYYPQQIQDFGIGRGENYRYGITVVWRFSAGLNLANDGFDPNLLYTDPRQAWRRVQYCSGLKAWPDGTSRTHSLLMRAQYTKIDGDGNATITEVRLGPINVTVHDSFRNGSPLIDQYGGRGSGHHDWMAAFPSAYPLQIHVDPLQVDGYSSYVQMPDEGTSSSTYSFRVEYRHEDGRGAKPWIRYYNDWWNPYRYESGVVLYLRNLDRAVPFLSDGITANPLFDTYYAVFQPHFMYKEDQGASDGDCVYALHVGPRGPNYIWNGTTPAQNIYAYTSSTNHFYESLPPGRYEYFYACSDDDYSAFDSDDIDNFWWFLDDKGQVVNTPFGTQIYGSSPVNPGDPRLFGAFGRNWALSTTPDTTPLRHNYVDKYTYMPGAWSSGYQYDSWTGLANPGTVINFNGQEITNPAYTFPEVNPGLYQVGTSPVGSARFLGTLSPYKRSVIPGLGDQAHSGHSRMWSETAGGTDADVFTFQVMYWQSQGIPPAYVRMYWKNDWNGEDPTGWRTVDMAPAPGQALETINYMTGVKYVCQLSAAELGYGPHCYYFEAADQQWTDMRYQPQSGKIMMTGGRKTRFPKRPETHTYNGTTFYDWNLPGRNPAIVDDATPLENDFINGPYINTRPQIVNDWVVTPLSGPSGTGFVYRGTYRDADDQRPYSATITIVTDESTGETYTTNLSRADDSAVPGNSTKTYAEGVVYEFRASGAPGLRYAIGNHKFRVSFTDDWGRQTNQDDRVSGETVASGWYPGPYLSGNSAPRLSLGSVESADGTSNEATVWNYKVTYTDSDNTPPAYVLVYVGRQDTPGGAIIWDAGHRMTASVPGDNVYHDGKEYQFSTQLAGDNDQPIKYYHCFAASDGLAAANYHATNSPDSGMIWPAEDQPTQMETLTPVGGQPTHFLFANKPLVTDVPPSSQLLYPTNYVDPEIYVVSLSDVATKQSKGTDYTLDPLTGLVTFNTLPGGTVRARYWFGTEPDPADGPAGVTGNHSPMLTQGRVLPPTGTSATQFVYVVIYQDPDGQAPQFVNAVIDDVRYPMVNVRNSTTYKDGVEYQCTATLTTGNHQFYFECSDGGAMYIFDVDPNNTAVDPIAGPYVNDRPSFSEVSIIPNGTVQNPLDQGQPITYGATIVDMDNDQPLPGYPVVYVDNPTEQDWSGTVSAVADNKIVDDTQSWTPGQFNGMPVQVDSVDQSTGAINRRVYKIDHNTETELFVVATDVPDVITVNSPFQIGKLTMSKVDGTDGVFSDGVAYESKVPSLGVGTHSAHFVAVVNEQVQPGVYQPYTLRSPLTGEHGGPVVEARAPVGNVPPVLTNGNADPRTGTSGTSFRFSVRYTDQNGDLPAIHDQVQGYIKVYIEETPGVFTPYDLGTEEGAPNPAVGIDYAFIKMGLELGPHNYYFVASDGWTTTRYPSTGYQTVYVSRPPVLVGGHVDPVSGNTGRVYEYKVTYKDPDNDPPAYVYVVVDGGEPQPMGVPYPGADFINGFEYSLALPMGSLAEGSHEFYFYASDGNGYAWYDQDVRDQEDAGEPDPRKSSTAITPPTPIRPILGPSVHSNTACTLSGGTVTPATGFDLDTFTYSVVYTDPDGDEPEYVEVYIDDQAYANDPNPANCTASRSLRMAPVIANPTASDFVNGVTYSVAKQGLASGAHTYYFRASDYMAEVFYPGDASGAPTTVISGPNVLARSTATITLNAPSTIAIGDSLTLTGTVTGYNSAPIANAQLQVHITMPNNLPVTSTPIVTTNANGQFMYPSGSAAWRPPVTGTWKVQVSWAGNTQYLLSTSPERSVAVAGPSYSVNGLDMISVPIQPISTFPDGVLGSTPPFALAKWVPSRVDYKLYSLLPGIRTDYDYPGITPGQAFWIKTLVAKNIAPTGSLVDPTSDYSVPLGVGWSQVGCPFTTEVSWSALRVRRTVNNVTSEVSLATAAANGWIREYGWTYDPASGSYKLVDATRAGAERTMRPWRGYWVKALATCTLVIPAPNRSGAAELTRNLASAGDAAPAVQPKWQVQFIAKNGELKDECNYLGASNAKDEKMESPGCFQNYVDLYFTDGKDGTYASYLKAKVAAGTEWTFDVTTDKAGEVELTWNGLDALPGGMRLVLVDEDDDVTEVVSGGSYKFTAEKGGTTKTFRVRIEK